MPLEIEAIAPARLPEYARIPMVCNVLSILQPREINGGLGGLALDEQPIAVPYLKDYDADGNPTDWPRRFDISNWKIWLGHENGSAVAGATVICNTPGLDMLEGRSDLAVLWDIRVHPDNRSRGVGTLLFQQAARWAKSIGCRTLKIETQNVNLAACRFYAKMGCSLGQINRRAYHDRPRIAHEIMLLWYLNLSP